MRRNPFAIGLSLLGVATAGLVAAGTGVAHANAAAALEEMPLRQRRGKGQNNKRGKGAARRHGAKLRSNRLVVSRRVKRKHRKARRGR